MFGITNLISYIITVTTLRTLLTTKNKNHENNIHKSLHKEKLV